MNKTVAIIGGGPVGLFMSRLLLLNGIDNIVFEKNVLRNAHAKAHFLNLRTMEIFRSTMPNICKKIQNIVPPSELWRNYAYGYSVFGPQFLKVDHFSGSRYLKWIEESKHDYHLRPSSNLSQAIAHIPQRNLEDILLENLSTLNRGLEITQITQNGSFIGLLGSNNEPIVNCEYLIVADGSNGEISNNLKRNHCKRTYQEQDVQNVINIRFQVTDSTIWDRATTPAMLYFVFNETICCVIVRHGLDEGVCQVPFFPSLQPFKDYSVSECIMLLRAAFGLPSNSKNDFLIHSISAWSVAPPIVADQFSFKLSHICGDSQDDGSEPHKIFLVGDAAHTFPPAGGFGLNTGLQDAHNLAWKIALHKKFGLSKSHACLASYDKERRPICHANADLSWSNYTKIRRLIESLLGIPNKSLPFISSALTFAGPMLGKLGLKIGLAPLAQYRFANAMGDYNLKKVFGNLCANDEDLGMIFPNHDIGFKYPLSEIPIESRLKWNVVESVGLFITGKRMPHVEVNLILKNRTDSKPVSLVDLLSEINECSRHLLILVKENVINMPEKLSELLDVVIVQPAIDKVTIAAKNFNRFIVDDKIWSELAINRKGHENTVILVRPDSHVSCIFSTGDCVEETTNFVENQIFMSNGP